MLLKLNVKWPAQKVKTDVTCIQDLCNRVLEVLLIFNLFFLKIVWFSCT
jgi:hypothetical protein